MSCDSILWARAMLVNLTHDVGQRDESSSGYDRPVELGTSCRPFRARLSV